MATQDTITEKDIYVGAFTEEQCRNKEDKDAVEEAKQMHGCKYVKTKLTTLKGVPVMKIWVTNELDWKL